MNTEEKSQEAGDLARPASTFEAEQRRLASANTPGLGEADMEINATRNRLISVPAARLAYIAALEYFQKPDVEEYEKCAKLLKIKTFKRDIENSVPIKDSFGTLESQGL